MTTLKLSPNALGSGQFTIAAPNSNNTRTMTLADSSGTIYIAPGDGIQALAGGIPAARTITAGTGVSVSNGDGVAGNPTITNSGVTSFSAGTTGLTPSTGTTGSVTLAGTLAVANGGTGLSTTPTNGQLDIGNGTGFTRAALTQGTGISVTNGAGSITVANSGVTSITASTGISASASTGGVTLTNSGVTSIVAGSNITISGGTGAVTISASSGASTTYGAVGTYIIAAFPASANTTYAGGTTIAGSSLTRPNDVGNNSNYQQFLGQLYYQACNSVQIGAPGGETSLGLSGTWQFMSRARNGFSTGQSLPALFVRIS